MTTEVEPARVPKLRLISLMDREVEGFWGADLELEIPDFRCFGKVREKIISNAAMPWVFDNRVTLDSLSWSTAILKGAMVTF